MTVFGDTLYFLALANLRDPAHAAAVAWAASTSNARLLTTTLILAELADALCRRRDRTRGGRIVRGLLDSPFVTVVSVDESLFEAGLSLYESRPDKDWSLTDCVSFVVMEREGLAEALTGDRHFAQAGFRPLLDAGPG